MWRNEPSHSQMNSMLGVGVPMDFRIFRMRSQWSKPIFLKSFLYHWKDIEMLMSIMGSHCPFGHLKHKLWSKERPGVKLAIWLPTTKSRELTQFPGVHAAWDIPLESSWLGLQLCFQPHCNWRSSHQVMGPQSCGNPRCGNFGIPTWESWDKKPFGCGPHGEVKNII